MTCSLNYKSLALALALAHSLLSCSTVLVLTNADLLFEGCDRHPCVAGLFLLTWFIESPTGILCDQAAEALRVSLKMEEVHEVPWEYICNTRVSSSARKRRILKVPPSQNFTHERISQSSVECLDLRKFAFGLVQSVLLDLRVSVLGVPYPVYQIISLLLINMLGGLLNDKRTIASTCYVGVLCMLPSELRPIMYTVLISAVIASVWTTENAANALLRSDRDGRDAGTATSDKASEEEEDRSNNSGMAKPVTNTAVLMPGYLGVSWQAVHACLLALGTGLYLLPWPNTAAHTQFHTLTAASTVICAAIYIYICAFATGMEYGRYTATLPAQQALASLNLPIRPFLHQRKSLWQAAASAARPGAGAGAAAANSSSDENAGTDAGAAAAARRGSTDNSSRPAQAHAYAHAQAQAQAAASSHSSMHAPTAEKEKDSKQGLAMTQLQPLTPVSAGIIANARAHAQVQVQMQKEADAEAGAPVRPHVSSTPPRTSTSMSMSSSDNGVGNGNSSSVHSSDGRVSATILRGSTATVGELRPKSWGPGQAAAGARAIKKDQERDQDQGQRQDGQAFSALTIPIPRVSFVTTGSGKHLLASYYSRLSLGEDSRDVDGDADYGSAGGEAEAAGAGAGEQQQNGSFSRINAGSLDSSGISGTRTRGRSAPALLTDNASFGEESERGVVDRTTDDARQALFALLGYEGVPASHASLYDGITWDLQQHHNDDAGQASIWASASNVRGSKSIRDFGIVIRGNCYCRQPASLVAQWIERHGLCCGFEVLSHEQEVQFRTQETGTGHSCEVKRLICRSGSVMRAKRDFIIVTCHSITADGTDVLTSRSLPDDIEGKKGPNVADKNGVIRGVCYTSGYVLHPCPFTIANADGTGEREHQGCEISYACHINMRGGGSTNELRRGPLVNGGFNTLVQLAELPVLEKALPTHQVAVHPKLPVGPQSTHTSVEEKESAQEGRNGKDVDVDVDADVDGAREEISQNKSSHLELLRHCSLKTLAHLKRVHISTAPVPQTEPEVKMSVSPRAVVAAGDGNGSSGSEHTRARGASGYPEGIEPDAELAAASASHLPSRSQTQNVADTAVEGQDKKKFAVQHAAKGVTVSEKSIVAQVVDLPMEMLCATVSTNAAPSVVRRLLRESPRAVDNMLEGHRVLLTLSPTETKDNSDTGGPASASASASALSAAAGRSTYVQHLQYGAIWPVGARDYLLITSEEDFYSADTSGSSSGSGSKQERQKNADGSASDADADRCGFIFASTSVDHLWSPEASADDNGEYSRSTLRLAGYVGEANATGGTDLTMYVDLGVAAYIPSWMLQMLANYGLSEMMRRIRHAADKAAMLIAQEAAERAAAIGVVDRNSDKGGFKAPGAVSAGGSIRARARSQTKRDEYSSPEGDKSRGRDKGMGLRTAAGSPIDDHGDASGGDFFDDDDDDDDDDAEDEEDDDGEGGALKSVHSFTSQHKEGGGMRQSMQSLQSPAKRGSLGSWSAVDSVEGDGFVELAQEAYDTIQQYLCITSRTVGSVLPSCMKKHAKFLLMKTGKVPEQAAAVPLSLQWTDKGGKAGIKVHNTKVPGSDWCAIKASVTLQADKHDIRKLLMDDARCGEYDDMYDKFTLLRSVDERTSVRLVQMKGIWPTAPREFILLSSWAELSDGSLLIFSKSPDADDIMQICDPVLSAVHAKASTHSPSVGPGSEGPLDAAAAAILSKGSKGYVRGSIVTSGYLIEPIPSGDTGAGSACNVTLVAHTELGGSLPSSIINSLATGAPIKLLQGVAAVLGRRR